LHGKLNGYFEISKFDLETGKSLSVRRPAGKLSILSRTVALDAAAQAR
jgi:hypothetical protein